MKLTNDILKSTPYQYACDVRDGNIITGKKIKLAVKRFFTWIDKSDEQGYYLDHVSGMHIITFAETFIRHTKGELGDTLFKLSPYQQFTVYNIGAWKDFNGKRRIRTVYEKVARKNGKSAVLAFMGLYFLIFDEEASPEIYAAATKKDQAKILWKQAVDMVKKSPELQHDNKIQLRQTEIRFKDNLGLFSFLGRDSETQDGLNPTLAVIDEYHAHKDDSVREVLESAMGARRNPLLYIITTAGFNVQSACKRYEEVCEDILKGIKEDDRTLIMIHDLDEGDDWENEKNWVKANPNLEVSTYLENIREEYIKAKNQPSKIPNFKTKHLNMWVDAQTVRIQDEVWMQNSDKVQLQNLMNGDACIGLDLSTTTDLTAAVLVSTPDSNGVRDILPFIYCPLDTVDRRSKEDRVPYRSWKDMKLSDYLDFSGTHLEDNKFINNQTCLKATHGNQVDYSVLEDEIMFLWDNFNPRLISYDRDKADQLVQRLTAKDIQMFPFAQVTSRYNVPTKEFERLAHMGKLRHGGHPILRWMMSGCVAKMDSNENIRYDKSKSTKRIDGIIATIMGLAGTYAENETNESNYNNLNPNEITF